MESTRSVAGVAFTRVLAALTLPALVLALVPALAARSSDDDRRESKAPSESTRGEVYDWKFGDGLPFEYFVPKSYDAKKGANLVLVLHGNGLNYHWTFWNHPPGEFRPDDIVVSPEGPTFHQGTGAYEFMAGRDNCKPVHELIVELKKVFEIRQTFLYGHSQGSFFVYEYAGEFPDDIDGVVGHAGALWMSSKLGKSGHELAIAFLHGTDDANVPWRQSVAGREAYREAGYPKVHLRTMWGWPHAPNWHQAQNQLAWCEGMTSGDPERVAAALATLSDEKANGGVDFAALAAVATRLGSMAGASAAHKSAASRARTAVDKLAGEIAGAIDRSLGKGKLTKVDGKPWLGMTQRFLEDFDGVAACEAWKKSRSGELSSVGKTAKEAGEDFWRDADEDPAKALAAGIDLLEKGWSNLSAGDVADRIDGWLGRGGEIKLPKKEAAAAKAAIEAWRKGRADGFADYEKMLRKLDL